MIKFVSLTLLSLLVVAPGFGQKAIESEPGFVNVKEVEQWFDQEPNLEVNIYGALLNLVAEASRFEDPELAELLHNLKGISVRGFRTEGIDMQSIRNRTSDMSSRLKADGWETIVKVRDREEFVDMYLKTIDDRIAGMVVMVIDEDEDAVFVNIIGEIDPEQIGRIGHKFNVSGLGRF